MTSIHNNAGAMVALSTLSMINKDLTAVQGQISTGRKIDNASQNAAIWAVTTVMKADVAGFESIAESLSLGKATVTVARNASEKVTKLLQDMKKQIVAAQGENVDRGKIQTDIDELRNQINSIVSSAQFNGLNLIDGSKPEGIKVISSLDRSQSGVETGTISVRSQNLSSGNAVAGDGADTTNVVTTRDSGTNAVATGVSTVDFAIGGGPVSAGQTAEFELFIDDVSVGSTVRIAEGTTVTEARQKIQEYVTGLGREDLKATVSATGVEIENLIAFDSVKVELKELNLAGLTGGTAATTLKAGISSLETASNDSATVANIEVSNWATGDTFKIEVGGFNLGTWDGSANASVADDATAAQDLARFINDAITANASLNGKLNANVKGITGVDAETVEITNQSGENFQIKLTVVAGGGDTELDLAGDSRTAATAATAVKLTAATTSVDTSIESTIEGKGADIQFDDNAIVEGDSYSVYLRTGTDGEVGKFTYVAAEGDDANDVANGLKALIDEDDRFDVYTSVEESLTPTTAGTPVRLRIDGQGSENVFVAVEGKKGGAAGGGLSKLSSLDVSTAAGAAKALEDIEGLIQASIDAAASFGSSESRLNIQAEFVDSLVKSLSSGIGALVDTDMEAASARLQALQVQQQLGTQALSIANSAPQNILSLFR